MTRPSNRKRGKNRKSALERVPIRPSKGAEAKPIHKGTLASPILRSTHDHFVVQALQTTPVGELAVDPLVRDATQAVPALRSVLSDVYLNAALAREMSKATRDQLKNARSTLSQLARVVKNLEKISTDGREGLRMLLEGSPLDDEKGERELNELASACWKAPIAEPLEDARAVYR
jgi:hypothetical protein